MPRNWEQSKEASPLPPRVSSKINANAESRRLRYTGRMTSKSRTRRSTSRNRRSRSPRAKKSLSPPPPPPPPKRSLGTPEKRAPLRSSRSDSRPTQKRSRVSPRNRNKTPPPPRRLSRDRPRSFSVGKDHPPEKTRNSQIPNLNKRDDASDRFHGGSKYVVDKPLFRGPDKDLLHDRDNLKKIVVNMRDIGPGNEPIKGNMANPEVISLARRAEDQHERQHKIVDYCGNRGVTARGSRDYREMDNGRMSRPVKYDLSPPLWSERSYAYGRTINHEEPARYTSESTRLLFDRDEVTNHRRKFEDSDRDRRRGVASSDHPDRRHCEPNSSNVNLRTRDPYYDDGRRGREYPNMRPSLRDYDSRAYDKPRDDRPRDDIRFLPPPGRARSRSYDRSRDPPDRKDRYDDRDGHRIFRRSLERLPPDDRLLRRHPSPGDSRRHFDDYRLLNDRRERSLDRRDMGPLHYRDHEFAHGDRFSGSEYLPKNQAYYENDFRESRIASPSRGRGQALPFRGRGPSSSTFPRSADAMMDPVTSVRPARDSFIPREPSGRRLSFPPRKSFRGSFEGRH